MGGGGKLEGKNLKTQCFIMIGAFAMIICLLAFVSSSGREAQESGSDQVILFAGISVVSLVACGAWTWWRLWPKAAIGESPSLIPPSQFVSNMIIGLAFAEFPGILGFAMAPVLKDARYAFFAGSLFAMLLFVLPATLRYWSQSEAG